MNDIIISNHLRQYMDIPKDYVFLINLALIYTLAQLESELLSIPNNIIIDFPEKRIKYPQNKYPPSQIFPLIEKYKNIKYIAISNVEFIEDIQKFSSFFNKVEIILKIESYTGYKNLSILLDFISKIQDPICQIDTEDLQRDIEKRGLLKDVWDISNKINIICKGYKNGTTLNLGGEVFITSK